MTDSIKVTQNGYKKLIAKKQELFERLKVVQSKKGEAAEVVAMPGMIIFLLRSCVAKRRC